MAITTQLVGKLGKGWRKAVNARDVQEGQVYAYRNTLNNAWFVSVSGYGTTLDMSRDPYIIDPPY